MKNNPSLPWNSQVLVDIPTIEELMHQTRNLRFHLLLQDDIIPTRVLDLLIQSFTPDPPAIIDINPFVSQWWGDHPLSNRLDQLIRLAIARHDTLPFRRLLEDVLQLNIIVDRYDVDDEVLIAPFVQVFGKCSGFAERGEPIEIAGADDGLVDNVKGGSRVPGKGKCEEIHCTNIAGELDDLRDVEQDGEVYHCEY